MSAEMDAVLVLTDPASGEEVRICVAQLAQSCTMCSMPVLPGDWIVAAGPRGWVHLTHHVRALAGLELSERTRAADAAREQLRGCLPGESVRLSREAFVALGLDA